MPGELGRAEAVAAQGEVALVQLRQQDERIGLAAAELERLGLALPAQLVPAQRQHSLAERQVAAPVCAQHVALVVRAEAVRGLGEEPQLLSLARTVGKPLLAAR